MINELLDCMEPGRYAGLDSELAEAFDLYEAGEKEKCRQNIEEQTGRFVNPDEFFPGGVRNQAKIDDFRREMTLQHSGQQMLWSFAGTTGAMTVLTERHLESLGRSLEGLKPDEMKKQQKAEASKEPGVQRLYLYGTGEVSDEYDKESARLSFNRLKEPGGFYWGASVYDRNYEVEKSNWTGAVDESGDWVRLEKNTEDEGETRGIRAADPGEPESIKLVYTLNGVLLYDTALLLSGREKEEYYYTLQGDLYGGVKMDRQATLKKVKEALGDIPLAGIVLPPGTPEEIKEKYRHSFAEPVEAEPVGISTSSMPAEQPIPLFEENSPELEALVTEDSKLRAELEEVSRVLNAVVRLKQMGLDEEQVQGVLTSADDTVEVPLNPFLDEDRVALAGREVSEETGLWLKRIQAESSVEELAVLTPALASVLALAVKNGQSEMGVLDEARSIALGKPAEKSGFPDPVNHGSNHSESLKLQKVLTLQELAECKNPFSAMQNTPVETDFFKQGVPENIAEKTGLSDGETASLKEALGRVNIPPVDRKVFNTILSPLLKHYRSIQLSTGMTLFDVTAAADSMAMKRLDAARFASKAIHFETDVNTLVKRASNRPQPVKMLNKSDLFRPLVIAATSVESLQRTSFQEEKLQESEVLTQQQIVIDPVELTRAVLSDNKTEITGDEQELAVPLTTRQLALLKSLYLQSDAEPLQAEEAVSLWKKQSFTAETYKQLRQRVKAGLTTWKKSEHGQFMIKKAGFSSADNLKTTKDSLYKGASDNSNTLNLIEAVSNLEIPDAERQTVQAVAEEIFKSISPDELALPADKLLPSLALALGGRWNSIDSETRQVLKKVLSRVSSSFTRGHRPIVSKSRQVTPVSQNIYARLKQIPVPVTFDKNSSFTYQNVAYRVHPGTGHIEAVTPEDLPINKVSPLLKGSGRSKLLLDHATGENRRGGSQPEWADNSRQLYNIPPKLEFMSPSESFSSELPGRISSGNGISGQKPILETVKASMSSNPDFSGDFLTQMNHQSSQGVPVTQSINQSSSNPLFSASGQGQSIMLTQSFQQSGSHKTELSRMDKINANYEADKQTLDGQSTGERMLARSNTNSVGHAGGSTNNKSVKGLFVEDVIIDLQQED